MLISPFLELAKSEPELPCLYRLKDEKWISYSRDEVVQAATRLCAPVANGWSTSRRPSAYINGKST